MQKKLVVVGNGLALFIDRSLQKLLDLDARSVVSVKTDGVRLMIEPIGHSEGTQRERARPRLEPWDAPRFVAMSTARTSEERRFEFEARAVLDDLIARGMTSSQVIELHHRRWPEDRFRMFFASERPWLLDDHDRADLRRFAACRRALLDGESMNAAISRACAEVPMAKVVPWYGYAALQRASRVATDPVRAPAARHSILDELLGTADEDRRPEAG